MTQIWISNRLDDGLMTCRACSGVKDTLNQLLSYNLIPPINHLLYIWRDGPS